MDFRRNQEDMVGFNPQIRSSAFSKPLLPPTASLLSSPRGLTAAAGVPARNNGAGSTATSDVFDPAPAVEHHHPLRAHTDSDLAPAVAVSDGLLNAVAAATPTTTLTGSSTSATTKDSSPPGEPAAKYRECLRNHAASLGGHVLDGCGDFMPGAATSGGGGDPLKCAACGCHRSFHRKEIEGEQSYFGRYGNGASPHQQTAGRGRLPLLLPPPPLHHHPPPQQWLARSPSGAAAAAFGGNYSGSGGATTESSSEEHPGGPSQAAATAAPGAVSRKRFRSKFTTEQKKRMLGFAESVGWRMQKQDEAAVEQFCADVGVRRQVLKVWMHNNKHTLRKQQHQYHDHDHQQQHQDQQQQPHQIQEHHPQPQPQQQQRPQSQQPQQQQQHHPLPQQLQRPQSQQPQQQHHPQPQQLQRPQSQQPQQQHHPQPQQQHHPQPQQQRPQSQQPQQQHHPQPQQQHHPLQQQLQHHPQQ